MSIESSPYRLLFREIAVLNELVYELSPYQLPEAQTDPSPIPSLVVWGSVSVERDTFVYP